MPKSVRLKSFELVARDIAEVDVESLHALTVAVGWPHRPKDWDWLRKLGRGFAVVDGIDRVFGSAMWFPYGNDFAMIGLVITTPRSQAQGNGRWLMEQVFEQCQGRDLGLNSTRASHNLYVSLGFRNEATVCMYQGTVAPTLPMLPAPQGELTEPSAGSLEDIIKLDMQAFGWRREELIKALEPISTIRVLKRDGQIVGYSMCREFGRGHVVGPVVASNDQDALHLIAIHLKDLKGQFARVDTRDTGSIAQFLGACDLKVAERVTTMSKGRVLLNRKPDSPWIYGLAGHALG
jgi:GNAT superfamily N-acetyltransferase